MCKWGAKWGYALGSLTATIGAAFLAAGFASGSSLVELKNGSLVRTVFSPAVTGPTLPYPGTYIDYSYGVGVRQDTNGNFWTAEGHPAKLLGCQAFEEHGLALVGTVSVAFFALLVATAGHTLLLLDFKRVAYWATGLGHLTLSVFLAISLFIGVTLWSRDWVCTPPPSTLEVLTKSGLDDVLAVLLDVRVVDGDVTLTLDVYKHFNLTYGVAFLVVGIAATALSGILILFHSEEEPEAEAEAEPEPEPKVTSETEPTA